MRPICVIKASIALVRQSDLNQTVQSTQVQYHTTELKVRKTFAITKISEPDSQSTKLGVSVEPSLVNKHSYKHLNRYQNGKRNKKD